MGKCYVSPSAVCPYYRSQTGSVIYCEGMEENNSIHMAFGDPKQRESFQQRCCKSWNYEKCRIAQAHELAWKEDE